ncbi:O-antigen ligase family protein [Horticoccus luteus]|uniref:O-antigen ligase family protein n=1 Tax=Horticoccus luteus TaxID=2862869 RepID=A0A8F9TYJ3_9BACT|nr:O-antigen ligase family protein [Horticoccus luteus]QYM80352.1 O-antigen ligase family protein [Horticoccus luteus]
MLSSSVTVGVLRTATGVVLLVALIVGPLNFASTRPEGFHLLIGLCALAGALWIAARVASQSIFPPSKWVWAAVCTCVGVACFWSLQPPAPLPEFTTHHLARVFARWPRSMVPRDPASLILWAISALGALLATWDLARAPKWRLAFVVAMVGTGVVAATVGLLQNATHAHGIYWEQGPRFPGMFFGPFYHHTSAGAYLNSVWPLAAVLALSGFRDGTSKTRWIGALGGIATVLLLVAHAGHISRFPQVIAVLVLIALIAWLRPWNLLPPSHGVRVAFIAAVVAIAGSVALFGAGKVRTIQDRWSQLQLTHLLGRGAATPSAPAADWPRLMRGDLFVPSQHANYVLGDRGAAYATAWRAMEARPWLGWGPGGWTAAAAAESQDPFIRTFFLYLQFTHNDYLQTVVEWGLVGAAGWAFLVFGGIAHAAVRLLPYPAHDLFGAGAIAALLALLAQSVVDFPLQVPAIQLNAVVLIALAWSAAGPADRLPISTCP